MEMTATMPASVMSDQTVPKAKSKAQEHWLVEVVGGMTLANTIVSSLALFYLFMTYSVFGQI